MRRDDLPDLYRRVLSLPDARLSRTAGGASNGELLPTFSILYVYDVEQQGSESWLQVGRSAVHGGEGWLSATAVEDWRTMLVLQYAPKGARGRVLFFKRQQDLATFATDRYAAEEVSFAYESIESGEYDADYFVAIEPSLGIQSDASYLMPILSHDEAFTLTGERLTLLEVAGLNIDAAVQVQKDVREVEDRGVPRRSGALRRIETQVAFLIDTTRSMGPYIRFTQEFVESTIGILEEMKADSSVSYGLVGFRDNMTVDDRIGYVTKIFQPLDAESDGAATIANFSLMEDARVATSGFSEDAFAGLYTALNELDWKPNTPKILFVITDAAPREPTDPLAAFPGYGVLNVIDDAERLGVGIIVLHLNTPEAGRSGNAAKAKPAYQRISRAGDANLTKYVPIDTRDAGAFMAEIEQVQAALVEATRSWKRGSAIESSKPKQEGVADNAGQALVNELFRGQLEYLGQDREQGAPRFYRAWAADRDLANPLLQSLEVKVFLTRNQLAALSKGVENILDAYLRKQTGGGDFFAAMQSIAAETSVEGGSRGAIERAGELLPSFLSALPYRSDFLELDRQEWSSRAGARQQEMINTLESKLRAYRDRAEQRQGWLDLGAEDRGLDVLPLSLNLLP